MPNTLLLYNSTLVGQVFLQMKVLTVEYSIGEISDPIAQADYSGIFGNADVEWNMPMSKYQKFKMRILFNPLSGILDLVLLIGSTKGAEGAMVHSAFFRPPLCKSHGSIRVNPGI